MKRWRGKIKMNNKEKDIGRGNFIYCEQGKQVSVFLAASQAFLQICFKYQSSDEGHHCPSGWIICDWEKIHIDGYLW